MTVNEIRELREKDFGKIKIPYKEFPIYETYQVNKNFTIFVGPPGSGKVNKASSMADFTITCELYDDSDIKYIFKNFEKDTKSIYAQDNVRKAAEEGQTVCFDELDKLSDEVITMLIKLTNGEAVDFEGEKINVHPDFKIIATITCKCSYECDESN